MMIAPPNIVELEGMVFNMRNAKMGARGVSSALSRADSAGEIHFEPSANNKAAAQNESENRAINHI